MQLSGDNMTSIKRSNRKAVLYLLRQQGAMSRKMLAETMGLTPAAITKIVAEMTEEHLLVEGSTRPNDRGVGRAQILLELDTSAWCGLGLLINVGQALLSAVKLDGSVVFAESIAMAPKTPAEPLVKQLSQRLRELTAQHGLNPEKIIGLGVAVRGLIDPGAGIVQDSYGALAEKNLPLAEMFRRETGYPVTLDNNVRALFAAQMFLARDAMTSSQFFLRCEYGIGAALSIHNEIWTGSSNLCAELGHIPVIRRGGKPCLCGKCGCLETIASPGAIRTEALAICSPERTPLLWRVSEGMAKPPDLNAILDAARHGEAAVVEIVDKAVQALGAALKSVIYTIDPAKVVLYGSLFENSYYLSRLMVELSEGIDDNHSGVVIEKSPYNNTLEPMAAGILMVEKFFGNGGMKDE